MSEFNAVANLEVVPTGIDAAKREIESEFGDVEVPVTANRPTGQRGATDGGFRSSTAAMIEIQRRTLKAQRDSADADEVTNEILEEMLDVLENIEGMGGGGGGGGPGAGQTLLQVQGAQSVLGGAAGGISAGIVGSLLGGLSGLAGRAGGGAFPFMATGPGGVRTGEPGDESLRPGGPDDPVGQAFMDAFGAAADAVPRLELGLPDDFPPQLQLPQEDFPPKLDIPTEFPDIDVTPPPWLQGVAQGLGIDINVNTENTVNVVDRETRNAERQRFENARERNNIEPLVETEVRRMEQRLERRLKREFGAGTGTRTGNVGPPGNR